jgi:hypothetical protein
MPSNRKDCSGYIGSPASPSPIGIVVLSSAIGVSEELKKGLNKKVEALFKDKPQRRR